MSDWLWSPSQERVRGANLTAFIKYVHASSGAEASGEALYPHAGFVGDYRSLWRWSVDYPQEFWAALWRFFGVIADARTGAYLDEAGEVRYADNLDPWDSVLVGAERMAPPDADLGPRWFDGARLNFAENLLRHCSAPEAEAREALVLWNEAGRQRSLTYVELWEAVRCAAGALAALGVGAGDRVAGFLPNLPEAVIAMLATASLGAVWSSCSPDFGAAGVLDRFSQIAPRVLLSTDGYIYNGKQIETFGRTREILAQLPGIEHTVIVPYLGDVAAAERLPGALSWERFLALGAGASLGFNRLPFNHPLYIMYSSGTTGLPKCMVHSAGGTLVQHLKELALHSDVHPGDRVFYFTTCGWMMWNWLISSLGLGATVVLYDGAPLAPHPAVLWDMAQQERLTHFGASAKYLAALEKEGLAPARTHDLAALRTILSTGSPLAPHSFDYVYREIKTDVCLSSISGGTDIISCFALGNPIGPVYCGELQARGLGMAVEVFDAEGQPVRATPGELVCTRPFPSMPVGFWNDPDGAKYRSAYFERFPGVWCHGDWVELTEHGGLIIYGRSDATLNPGGVRIGTAEIYRQVERLPEVQESLVVGQEWDGDVRIVLFVRLREGLTLSDALRERIRRQVREHTSPHHVPKKIIQVRDIPRTLSGKIVELAVRETIHGRPVQNVDALANPQALEEYRALQELAD